MNDFNAELHARPSIYFKGPAFVEHLALMSTEAGARGVAGILAGEDLSAGSGARTRIEVHTEFVTVTRVTPLADEAASWPVATLEPDTVAGLAGARVVCRLAILVAGPAPEAIGRVLAAFGFGDTAASRIAADAAIVCSDFKVRGDGASRILLFNKDLNAYRLGRMVRRLCEIETYRTMSLLGLPEARRLGPQLDRYDWELAALADRNLESSQPDHQRLLQEISAVSARIISAAAGTRNRFGATAAYAKIVEERIGELRETHLLGYQRYGVFVTRRFRPAVRTCEATSRRLEQLSGTAVYLVDLLQTRIQVEMECQNAVQIRAMAERAATQIRIQKAVESFSAIAISYYLVGLIKSAVEAAGHAGFDVSPVVTLLLIPVVIGAVTLTLVRLKRTIDGAGESRES